MRGGLRRAKRGSKNHFFGSFLICFRIWTSWAGSSWVIVSGSASWIGFFLSGWKKNLIAHQKEGLVGSTLFAKDYNWDNLLESVNIGQLELLMGANLDIFVQTFDEVWVWYTTAFGILFSESVFKGGFLSESANRFSYLPKNIPNFYLELSWIWNLKMYHYELWQNGYISDSSISK